MSDEIDLNKLSQEVADTIADKCLNLRARHEDEVWNAGRCESAVRLALGIAHAAGVAAERARVVAVLTDEWTKWLAVAGDEAAIRADTLDDLLNRLRQ